MSDLGLTHIALPVTDVEASIAFYQKYARMRLLDAGCGAGRNPVYFLREGFDISAVNLSPRRHMSARLPSTTT